MRKYFLTNKLILILIVLVIAGIGLYMSLKLKSQADMKINNLIKEIPTAIPTVRHEVDIIPILTAIQTLELVPTIILPSSTDTNEEIYIFDGWNGRQDFKFSITAGVLIRGNVRNDLKILDWNIGSSHVSMDLK